MPVMDGLSATRAIRTTDSETIVIALTASVMEDDRRRCLEAGMNAHLGKPIEALTLLRLLNTWLVTESATVNSQARPALEALQRRIAEHELIEHEELSALRACLNRPLRESLAFQQLTDAITRFDYDEAACHLNDVLEHLI